MGQAGAYAHLISYNSQICGYFYDVAAVAHTTSGKPNVISNELLSAISVQTPWIETNCPLPIYWENRKMYAYLISGWIRRSTYLPNVKSKWLLSEQLAIKDSVIYELVIIKAAYLTRRRLVHTSDGAVDDYGFERGIDE